MRFRAPLPDDAPAVWSVLQARDVADMGAPDVRLEDLADEWGVRDFDLAADALVAEDEAGRIVAYAAVRRLATVAVVHPGYEGRGIGDRLLRWTEQRDRERKRDCHRQLVSAANPRGRALLQAAGYVRVRSYLRMVRPLADLAPPAPPPAGVNLRPLARDSDAAAVYAVDQASFAALSDNQPLSFEVFRDADLGARNVDEQLSLVAERGPNVVGYLLALRSGDHDVGYVDVLAVHPDEQGSGLGTAMLQTAFAGFAAVGLAEVQLGVASDNPRALALYESCGMTARHRRDAFERPVTATAEA